MNKLKLYFFYLLSIYPFFAFLFRQIIDTRPNFFIINVVAIFVVITLVTSRDIKFPLYLKFYLLFVIYTISSDFINFNINSDVLTGNYGAPLVLEYFVKNRLVGTFLILFLIENTYFPKRFIGNILQILYSVVIIATIVIIIQIYIPTFFLCPREYDIALRTYDFNRFSIFSWINTNEAGYSFPAIISILLSFSIIGDNKKKMLFLFCMGIIYSVSTLGRYIMLSVFIVLSQYLFYEKNRFVRGMKYIVVLTGVLFTLYLGLKVSDVPIDKFISEEILESDIVSFDKTSAYTRIFAFELFEYFFPKNPIWGTGGIMESDLVRVKGSRTSQIHVGWLSLFYYYGIVGGMFYLLFSFFIIKKLFVVARNTGYWGSLFAILTYFISIMGTGVTFEIFYMGFIFSVILNKYFEQNIEYDYQNKLTQ